MGLREEYYGRCMATATERIYESEDEVTIALRIIEHMSLQNTHMYKTRLQTTLLRGTSTWKAARYIDR